MSNCVQVTKMVLQLPQQHLASPTWCRVPVKTLQLFSEDDQMTIITKMSVRSRLQYSNQKTIGMEKVLFD